jgi:hypothetical protein
MQGYTTGSRSFVITNTGGGTLAGNVSEASPDYTITSGGGNFSLTAGQTRTVYITFTPTTTGTLTATIETGITICSDVSCTGVGDSIPVPKCEVNADTLRFGTYAIDSTSAAQSFTITNTGADTLKGSITETSANYAITLGGGSYALTTGQSRTAFIRFTPTVGGALPDTIKTGSTYCPYVFVTGGGCTLTPSTIAFGNIDVGDCSPVDTLTLTNSGTGTISGTIAWTCPDYEIISGGGAYSLTAGQSRLILIRFCPISTGSKSCTINF